MDQALKVLLERGQEGRVVVLTGAGISAESGIPTFRGEEGYWVVGAKEYHPQEMATRQAFMQMPRDVWRWYLYRRSVCAAAGPNVAHTALARLEEVLGDRMMLITQNVDGLHLRAGNSAARTCEVHGNIDYMRDADHTSTTLYPIPEGFEGRTKDAPLTEAQAQRLRVPGTDRPTRPHVLWFDEYYDEHLYRSNTAMDAAESCDLLIVIGSSGAASLPMHVAAAAAQNRAAVVDINPSPDNPFAVFARDYTHGYAIQGKATAWVPQVVDALVAT